ncbi:MAG: hypothetical protein F6K40_37690 [Okeania sp. SIO3I5]|nr:hypothetical protein [Okeania sp. SIO3I5]
MESLAIRKEILGDNHPVKATRW